MGTVIGGVMADRLGASRPSRMLSVPALATALGMPLSVGFLLFDSSTLSLLCFFPFYLLLNVYISPMYSVNQNLAKLRMRATASAILLFLLNIVGAGAGPFIVGALSDFFSQKYGAEGIRYAMLSITVAGMLGAICLMYSSRFLEDDLQRARE